MSYKFYFLLLISYFAFVQVDGQEEFCRPLDVLNLQLSDDFIVSWQTNPNETCTISHFLVTITIQRVETVYRVRQTSMNVSFLDTCETIRFVVRPVSSDDVVGLHSMIHLDMPLPPEANLTLHYLKLEQRAQGGVSLAWEMDEEWIHCAKHFRVLIYNEGYHEAVDLYVEDTSIAMNYILPCEAYTFGVTAIYNLKSEGPTSFIRYTAPSRRIAPPHLQHVILDTTSVVLDWQLESYTVNSCEVSSIRVDASPYFSATYPIRDDPERPVVSTRIISLQPDTIYFLNVTVFNTAGPSLPFLAAVQTLPNN